MSRSQNRRSTRRCLLYARVFSIAALVAAAVPWPAHAQPQYTDALRRSNFEVLSGDVNGDGYTDLLLRAHPAIVIIDFDVLIPILIPTPTPTFAILSDSSGNYSLVASPSASITGSSVWQPGTYDLVFGDLFGNGGGGVLIKPRSPGMPVFTVAASPTNGSPALVQRLTTATTGVDLGSAGISATLEDVNADGRADLLIRTNGTVTDALIANASGVLARDDESPIKGAWRGFTVALNAGDVNGALQYFSADAVPIYSGVLTRLGSELPTISSTWSTIKAIEVTSDYATFGLIRTQGSQRRIHFVTFVFENGRWLIISL